MAIEAPPAQPYTGKELMPGAIVRDGGKTLVAGTDYSLTYVNNIEVGTATIIATLKGNYEGSLTTSFQITENNKDSLNDAIANAEATIVVTSEDGSDVPANKNAYVTPTDQKALNDAVAAAKKVADDPNKTDEEIAKAKDDLSEAVEAYNDAKKTVKRYTVTFDANGGQPVPAEQTVNQNATATEPTAPSKSGSLFQGWELDGTAYDFSAKVTQSITLTAEWQAVSGSNQQIWFIDPIDDQQYKGDAVIPTVTVRDVNGNVVDPSKYDVAYKDNTASGKGLVVVSSKDNAYGSVVALFTINDVRTRVDIPTAKSFTYNTKARVGVASAEGYTLTGTTKATDAGTYEATAQLAKGYVWSDGTTDSITLAWKIKPAKITSVKAANQAYTGKAIKAKATVKAQKLVVPADSYTLTYKRNVKAGTATVIATATGNFTGTKSGKFKIKAPSVQYNVHRETYSWEKQYCNADGDQAGTIGQGKRLEGIYIRLASKPVSGSIQYRTYIQSNGWEKGWKNEGKMSGTSGKSKRMEAIQIRLTGKLAKKYNVWYRVYAQGYGWMGWAKNGASSGIASKGKRLESIQIVILPKGIKAPPATLKGAKRSVATPFVN